MPTDVSFPRPASDRCPRCDRQGVVRRRCTWCGLVLAGRDATDLWRIDNELHRLTVRRREVLGRLVGRSPASAPAPPGAPADAATDAATGRAAVAPPGSAPEPTVPAQPGGGPRPGGAPEGGPPPGGPWAAPGTGHVPSGPWAPGGPRVPAPGRPGTGDGPELTVPNLLLGLGTALIVTAAIVFAAVSWSKLGSAVQGLVLVGLTAAAVWGTRALHRRGLTATAEAVSVVTVALLPVDVHALREAAQAFSWNDGPGGDPLPYWCLGLWAMAVATWWFGRFSGTRAPRIIAAVAAQIPVPLYVIERPVEGAGGLLLCLAQAALAAVVVRRMSAADAGPRATAVLGAAGTWLVVTPLAVELAVDGSTADRLAGAGVLAVAAAVAGLAAALWPDDESVRTLGLATATTVGLAAAGLALENAVTGDAWWSTAAAGCAAVLVAAVRLPRRWGDAPAVVAATVGAGVSLPLVDALGDALAVAGAALSPAWDHDPDTPVRALLEREAAMAPGLLAAHLAVLAVAAVGVAGRLGRRVAVLGVAAVAAAAVVVTPLLADLPVAAALGLTLLAAGAPLVVLARPGGCTSADAPPAVGAVIGFAGLALVWGAAHPATTLVAVAGAGALAAALAVLAVRDGAEPLALVGAAAAVVAVAAAAGLGAAAGGASVGWAWVAAGWAAAAAAVVAMPGRIPVGGAAAPGGATPTGPGGAVLPAGAGGAAPTVGPGGATAATGPGEATPAAPGREALAAGPGGATPTGPGGADPGGVTAATGPGEATPAVGPGGATSAASLGRTALAAARGTGVVLYLLALVVVAARGGPEASAALVPAAIVGAGWFLARAVDGEDAAVTLGAVSALVVAGCAEVGLVVAALDRSPVEAWLAVGLAAAAATLAAGAVDPAGTRVAPAAVLRLAAGALAPAPAPASSAPGEPGEPATTPASSAPGGLSEPAATPAPAPSRGPARPPARYRGEPPADRPALDLGGLAVLAGEVVAAVVHVVALVALAALAADAAAVQGPGHRGGAGLGAAGAASVVLGAGAAVAAAHALRPGRRAAAVWAAVEATVLVWVQLTAAGVEVPEAYTAPVAIAFLAAAVVAHHLGVAGRYPSWWVHGPWLVMALGPTVTIALDDPGLVRPLGGLAAGALVLVGGAVTGRRAPVDVGAATVVVLGLRQLAPVVAGLPNWMTLGTCGLLLLVVGATFEERRRNVSTVLDRYAALS